MNDCQHHRFAAEVAVQRLCDEQGRVSNYLADVTVSCADCGVGFHFVGPETGLSFSRPTVSVGALTLHAPISPGEAELPISIRFEVAP